MFKVQPPKYVGFMLYAVLNQLQIDQYLSITNELKQWAQGYSEYCNMAIRTHYSKKTVQVVTEPHVYLNE